MAQRRWTRTAGHAGGALVVALALGACSRTPAEELGVASTTSTGPSTSPPSSGVATVEGYQQDFAGSGLPKLQFEGDSITYAARDLLNQHYGAQHDVAINATVGTDTRLESGAVAKQAGLAPAIEVINLGTNDAQRMLGGQPSQPAPSLDAVESRLTQFVHGFPPTTCVILVTINTHNPSWNTAGAQAINEHLRSLSPHIAEWDAAWDPAHFEGTDSPHPNDAGRRALVTTIDAAIDTCPR